MEVARGDAPRYFGSIEPCTLRQRKIQQTFPQNLTERHHDHNIRLKLIHQLHELFRTDRGNPAAGNTHRIREAA